MAIMSPADMPVIFRIEDTAPMKKYVLTKLGHPVVEVELTEDMFETVLKTTVDHIAHYFPKEQKMAYFYTEPLVSTYDMPSDAYWVQEVNWDPAVTRIGDIFGAESFLFNVGNVTGIQNILTDYVLLQQYRRFSQRVLSNEGHWEVVGDEQTSGSSYARKIRLYPTPKGAFPVVVMYIPAITRFRSPQARRIAMDMLLAESMIMLGNTRGKYSSIPSPDGGAMSLDGESLKIKGHEMLEKMIENAINLAEPMGIYRY